MLAYVVLGIAGACGAALWKSSSWRRLLDMRFAVMCVSIGLVSVLLVSILIQHLPDKRGVRLQATNFQQYTLRIARLVLGVPKSSEVA